MAFRFQCKTCGKAHEGLPSFGPEAPYAYFDLPETDQTENAILGSDNCIIDNELFFVRGCIEIPIVGNDQPFVWLVWCSLSEASYLEWETTFEHELRSNIGPFFGWLNTELPFHESTLNLETTVRLRNRGQRPLIELQEIEHSLFSEQRDGISIDRAEQLVHDLMHAS